MGALQRIRGIEYEREVAKELTRLLGLEFKRVLGQARDGGGDVTAEGLDVLFECKRRRTLKGVYEWMAQAVMSAALQHGHVRSFRFPIPAVVFRADDEESLVMFRLKDLALVVAEMLGDA